MDIKNWQKAKTEEINAFLPKYFPKEEGFESVLFEAMNYSVRVGGKRLRPMILLESCKMFGGDSKTAEPFAAAIEMIHTYSLVHDDLPDMDNDMYRRGNLTTHAKFGPAVGILAGDGLLNYAFEVMSEACLSGGKNAVLAMNILAQKAGIYGMIAGQTVDLAYTAKEVSAEILDYINLRKTSALLSGALMAGAALAGAGKEALSILENVGKLVGLAFQIRDDILDVTGDASTLGKPLHSDEKNEKNTYVSLFGTEKAEQIVWEYSQKAVEQMRSLSVRSEELEELLLSLAGRKF